MIEPKEIDLGERARVLPGEDPPLRVTLKRIPVDPRAGRIIPVCEPVMAGNELKYLEEAVETNWISSAGPFLKDFEAEFARAIGTRFAVSCSSGTAALHLVFAAMGISPGDEVIIPSFTMIATANTVRYCGGRPVLVDSEERTYNLDPDEVEGRITERTKAIVPIHTYGHPADMDRLLEISDKYGVAVIEDAAESHGAEYKGERTGSIGLAGTFSFYGNKIITTGEGGMITTNDEELASRIRILRDHAFSHERHFWHKFIGFNYRMTNLQAAIGKAQMERFEEFVERRIKNGRLYNEALADIPGIKLPPETEGIRNVYWMYGIKVEDEFGISRDELRHRLAEEGIETRTFFIPIHLQPIYFEEWKDEAFPVAEDLCMRGLYLPSSTGLTEEEIAIVTEAVRRARK